MGRRNRSDKWRTELGLGQIEQYCEDGLTNEELAKAMGISRSTLNDWLLKFPDISDAVTRGRGGARVQIKNALFERARGGVRRIKKPVRRRIRTYDEVTGKVKKEEEVIEYAEEEVYIPPDTNAIKFYLKNRDPEHWSDKVEMDVQGLRLEDLIHDD